MLTAIFTARLLLGPPETGTNTERTGLRRL